MTSHPARGTFDPVPSTRNTVEVSVVAELPAGRRRQPHWPFRS